MLAIYVFVYCESVTAVCACVCLLLWEIRQPPNYSKWSVLLWNGEREGGGETFSLRHPAVLLPGDARSTENAKRRGKPTC